MPMPACPTPRFNAQKLFQQYRHRQSTLGGSERLTSPGVRGSNTELSRTARMDKRDLRRLLHDADPELFEFVWGLLIQTRQTRCARMSSSQRWRPSKSASSDNLDDQIKACFAMFDTRDDGRPTCRAHYCAPRPHDLSPKAPPRALRRRRFRCAWIPFCAVAPR